MAVAARVKPSTFFAAEEWAELSRRSSWKGLALIAHAWAVIALAGAVFVIWPNPLTYIAAVVIIGGRQLGLAILMHDAAHGCIHPNQKVNDFAGHWLAGAPTNADLWRYRDYHLKHHKYGQQDEDPDLVLSAPFPVTRRSMRRKALRDLTGRTFYKQRIAPTIGAFRQGQPFGKTLRAVLNFWKPFLITNAILLAALTAAGLWWAWFALWLVPMATWYPLITRIRNIAEHALVAQGEPDPLRHARTTHANWLERAVLAPYWVNYHCEHHMFMHLPCWNLPKAHRLLRGREAAGRMLVEPGGYMKVLSLATSKGMAAAA
ncbi:MAG TPA: fatty acid desaturase family protein [Caulobacteraceae bacterium]|nr:fatty acid desaturase family protein [Caulobacteraceae bacterium]